MFKVCICVFEKVLTIEMNYGVLILEWNLFSFFFRVVFLV